MNDENKIVEEEKVTSAEEKASEENTESSETKTEGEQKENKKGFKAWFNKTKGDVNNYLLENKIENVFNKTNEEFSMASYNADAILSSQKQIFGYFDNDEKLVVFGEKEIPEFSIAVSNKTNKAYTILSKDSNCSVEVTVEGTKYVRSGTKFNIGEDPKEVKIIKVAGRTFIYEGK